jgi:hypothetical protein
MVIQIIAAIKIVNYMNHADTSVIPGPPMSTAAQSNGAGPQETSDNTVRNPSPTVVFFNTNRFL